MTIITIRTIETACGNTFVAKGELIETKVAKTIIGHMTKYVVRVIGDELEIYGQKDGDIIEMTESQFKAENA